MDDLIGPEHRKRKGRSRTRRPLSVALHTGDEAQRYSIEHGGETWTQQPGESLEGLQERAERGAMLRFRPTDQFPVLLLGAKRPPLTEEEWMKRYRPDASPLH